MSNNRHNIYVVLTGQQRGRIVRKGGHATQGYHYVSTVSDHDDAPLYGCEHKDNLRLVGCVTTEQWDCTYGPTAELCALAREGVWRTVEHVLSEQNES